MNKFEQHHEKKGCTFHKTVVVKTFCAQVLKKQCKNYGLQKAQFQKASKNYGLDRVGSKKAYENYGPGRSGIRKHISNTAKHL